MAGYPLLEMTYGFGMHGVKHVDVNCCNSHMDSCHNVLGRLRLFHHIKQASELKQGCDYSLFKKGILPMWEDDANKRGGRWLINLEKKHRGHDLNNYWLEVLLCLIGEAFDDYHEDVCGAVVNIRAKGDKIGIWTADALKSQSVLEIGRKVKTRLNINRNMPIGYQIHKDTMAKSGSVTKNSYTV
uniref:eIF-4F 25 kDa subunit n=1 Tax=Timema bartmani TaxID=61472 RepID=A0A7R9F215_9NEOP|nr:unnamed protein product [Timema bartmani]